MYQTYLQWSRYTWEKIPGFWKETEKAPPVVRRVNWKVFENNLKEHLRKFLAILNWCQVITVFLHTYFRDPSDSSPNYCFGKIVGNVLCQLGHLSLRKYAVFVLLYLFTLWWSRRIISNCKENRKGFVSNFKTRDIPEINNFFGKLSL